MHTVETLLARIDERTMRILEKIDDHIKRDEEIQDDLELRLRNQERFRYVVLGAAALATTGMGGLVTLLMK